MPRSTVTDDFKEAAYAAETDAVFVPIIKMTHASWPSDVLFVADTVDLTHNAELYTAYSFTLSLPDDEDEGFPVLKWASDNTTSLIAASFREVAGETGAVNATVAWVLTSHPEDIQAGPFDVEIYGVGYDAHKVHGTMTIEPVLEEAYGYMDMTPANAPGLF